MQPYANLDGNSGVIAYQMGRGSIVLLFRGGDAYVYDDFRPGAQHRLEMQRRARSGRGLATYVNQQVRDNFARKLSADELPALLGPHRA
jgi:hypothetical protein